jgi:uncharacterized protein with ATP-grasp and redox domains
LKTYLDCFPCFMNQALVSSRMSTEKVEIHKKILDRVMELLMTKSFDTPPPAIARDIYKIIREETKNNDPYREVKIKDNREMLNILPYFKSVIKNHKDPSLFKECN